MNDYNISRATQGLVAYLKECFIRENRTGKPKIAIAYDTRHFSRDFAQLTARVAVELGCDACLFDSPRSTPELSFAVRHTGSDAGIVITASHNPPHDNGYKCYSGDGAQVVEPHAGVIISKVREVTSEVYTPLEKPQQGSLCRLGGEIDAHYMRRLETLVLDPALVKKQNDLRIIFTPIHGTGGAIVKPMLERLGFHCASVPEQDAMDGRFPTVKSPNPENADGSRAGGKNRRGSGHRHRSRRRSHGHRRAQRLGRHPALFRKPNRFVDRLVPGKNTRRSGRHHEGKRRALCDHQDPCHHGSAKGHR
jgi:phosphoglucomutase